MANFTNSGLVAHCRKVLTLKTKYMWGGLMRSITAAYIALLFGIYGAKQYPASRRNVLAALIGKGYYGADCTGLVKSFIFGIGDKASIAGYNKYGKTEDKNVEGLYKSASAKGTMGTFKKVPGQMLFLKDFTHVGVYIGNGQVAEITLSKFGDGAVTTKFTDRPWYYWGQHNLLVNDTKAEVSDITTTTTPATSTSTELAVGDLVTIIAPYAAGAFVTSAKNTKAIGGKRYITKIYAGAKYPYQLGVKKGDRSTANTTGFAAASALKK